MNLACPGMFERIPSESGKKVVEDAPDELLESMVVTWERRETRDFAREERIGPRIRPGREGERTDSSWVGGEYCRDRRG